MPFIERSFDTPIYDAIEEEASVEPKRIVVISCEGTNTEPEYIATIKTKLPSYLTSLVHVEIARKRANESDPLSVVTNLEAEVGALQEKYDIDSERDGLWILIDRELTNYRREQICDILPTCEDLNFSVALSNPKFELWLLLHVSDIEKYDWTELLENEKDSRNLRPLDTALADALHPKRFSKKKGKFNKDIVSIENLHRAIAQEQKLCNELPDLLDKLGCNISQLIREFVDI